MSISDKSTLDGLQVLVVDDDRDTCVWLTYGLALYGIEVHSTFTVHQGLEAFVKLRPDLVVSDISMPDEDGYLLLRQIRQILLSRPEKYTPVIALTAQYESKTRFSEKQVWFDEWLMKPTDLEKLVEVIARLTGRLQLSFEFMTTSG